MFFSKYNPKGNFYIIAMLHLNCASSEEERDLTGGRSITTLNGTNGPQIWKRVDFHP